jgi:hypothetical protein
MNGRALSSYSCLCPIGHFDLMKLHGREVEQLFSVNMISLCRDVIATPSSTTKKRASGEALGRLDPDGLDHWSSLGGTSTQLPSQLTGMVWSLTT